MEPGTPSMRSHAFADLLHQLRIERALTKTQLAALVGLDRHTIGNYEAGRSLPKPELIRDNPDNGNPGPLAKALHVNWKRLAQAVAEDSRNWGKNGATLGALLLLLGWLLELV